MKNLLFILSIFFSLTLFSQKSTFISGLVMDSNTGVKIENADVTAKPKKLSGGGYWTGVLTKENGLFNVESTFKLPIELTVSKDGCGSKKIIIKRKSPLYYEISLDCDSKTIKEIILLQNPPPILEVKLDDGSMLSSNKFDKGGEIYIVNDEKRILMFPGEYKLNNSKLLVVGENGIIGEVKNIIIDSDGDGVPDDKDICPNESGDTNGMGCPSKPKEFMDIINNEKSLILFQVNSSKIDDNFNIVINELSKSLSKYPNISIKVSGHASSDGSSIYNNKLSQKRAKMVKKVLLEAGIDSSRIETAWFGEDQPLNNNSTEFMRAKNRRVDVSLNNK